MKEYIVWVETGYANQRIEEVVEIEDDATDEEIEEFCKEVAFQSFDWGYGEVTK